MPGPTTVHLVRHATHGLLPHTLAGRRPDVPLDATGQAEARALAAHFITLPIAAIVTSPVQRAQETASPIAQALGLIPQIDPGLDEIDFGTWTGQPFDALTPDPAWHHWNHNRALATCPGGETMHHAQSRALETLRRLHEANRDNQVILVSHADILKALLAPALGLPLDRLYRLTLDPASISTLKVFDGDWQVLSTNQKIPL